MAINPSQTKPVFQTADVPAGPTVTPASDIPKPKTITIKEVLEAVSKFLR